MRSGWLVAAVVGVAPVAGAVVPVGTTVVGATTVAMGNAAVRLDRYASLHELATEFAVRAPLGA